MESIERTFGPYLLLEELGRGGMGVVYRAQHQTTKQLVALKTLHAPKLSLSDALQREIYALSKLSHPNIVSIIEFGVHQSQPWYAMPLLDGKTLRSLCGAPWPEERILLLLRSLCASLALLHGSGIVHRDLKPENIILREDGSPVLVDFGLSVTQRELSREAIDDSSDISGTVEYMSPEQIMGEVVDARSDLYSLGCILYELLTGKPPFQSKIAAKILREHLQAVPKAPSHLQPTNPMLEKLTLQLLQKKPRDRVGHAASIVAMLGGAVQSAPYLYRPNLVGREEAITALSASLQALEEARGSLLLVGGVSGVGKTRILLELSRLAVRKQVRVITGQCLPRSDIEAPFLPLQKLLRALSTDISEDEASVLSLYEPSLATTTMKVAPELPPEAARLRLFGALSDALTRAARRQSMVLLLDDVQWADELTLGFLSYWRQRSAPVLLVAAYRSEEGQVIEKKLNGVPQILLRRLDEDAIGAMVGEMLAASQPREFVAFLLRSSEGNPFFVAEYLRAILRQGLLSQDSTGHWLIEGSAQGYESLPLPRTLRELLIRRLSGLSERAMTMVKVLSVLGRPASQRMLSVLAGLSSEATARTQELLSQQVFEESEEGLRFTHDKLREVAYESLRSDEATDWHKRAAILLREEGAPAAELGYHFERGGMPMDARPYYLSAARSAVKEYMHQEAERLFMAYLRLADESVEAIIARNELAKSVFFDTGRFNDAMAQSLITRESSRALLDDRDSAKRRHPRGGGNPESIRDDEKVSALLRKEEANSLFVEGISLWSTGKMDDGVRLLQDALSRYQGLQAEREEGATLHALGVHERTRGNFERASELCTKALVLHRKVKNRSGEGMSIGILAGIVWQRGDLEEARKLFEDTLAIHRENKNKVSEGIILGNLAGVFWQKRELEKAAEMYRQGLAIHREVGNRRSAGTTLSNLAVVEQELGHLERAEELLQESIQTLRELGDKFYLAHAVLFQAALARRRGGDLEEAERLLREAEKTFEEVKSSGPLIRCCCERGHLALCKGEDASQWIERARALQPKPKSEEERAVLSLEKANEQRRGLLRGERAEELPEGLRRRMAAQRLSS